MKIIIARNEGRKARELYDRTGWGRMYMDRTPQPFPGEPWAWDNGAYQAYLRGETLNIDQWKKRTALAVGAPTPYLAVLPDIVAGGLRSLELSLKHLADLPIWWPKYLPVQDGIDPKHVDSITGQIRGIFLGGSTTYKRRAKEWADFAHQHGLRMHYARAGTRGKLRHAHESGADSHDTACPLWIPRQYEQWLRWTREIETQAHLFTPLDNQKPPR